MENNSNQINNNNTNNNINNNNDNLNLRREKLKDLFINEAQGLQNEIVDKRLINTNINQDNLGIYDGYSHYVTYNEDYLNSFYSLEKKSYQNPFFVTPQQQNNPHLFKKYFLDYTISYYPNNPKTEMYKQVYNETYQNSNQY